MVKKFEFWRTFLRIPHFGTPKFCHLILCCYVNLSWKFYTSRLSVEKVWTFGGSVCEEPPFWAQNFANFYLFFILTYPENFLRLAEVVNSSNFGGSVSARLFQRRILDFGRDLDLPDTCCQRSKFSIMCIERFKHTNIARKKKK